MRLLKYRVSADDPQIHHPRARWRSLHVENYSEGILFVRQIPCIRPDVDCQVAIESAVRRDLVQVERGRHVCGRLYNPRPHCTEKILEAIPEFAQFRVAAGLVRRLAGSGQKKAPDYGAFCGDEDRLGGLAGKVSFSRRDVDRHAVVDEARRGDLRQIERARLSQAVEVPSEFLAIRSESNDFIVLHVDPLGIVVDGDRAFGDGSEDRALEGGRHRRLAQKVGGLQRGAGGQARRGKGQYGDTEEERLHVILHFDGWDECPIGASEMIRAESTSCKTRPRSD